MGGSGVRMKAEGCRRPAEAGRMKRGRENGLRNVMWLKNKGVTRASGGKDEGGRMKDEGGKQGGRTDTLVRHREAGW